jgi:pterin-4a-carbinolamine dehydratase
MQFGRPPINPKKIEIPIVPMNKWNVLKGPPRLSKTFLFRRPKDRSEFVKEMLDYEDKIGHNADIRLSESEVTIEIYTKDVERVTEVDKEYAKYSDEIYKEIVTMFKGREDGD